MPHPPPPSPAPDRGPSLREDALVIVGLALLLVVAFANVVFGGRSLVASESLNPLDERQVEEARGPGFIPASAWQAQNLVLYPNFRDPVAGSVQWDPAREFLHRSLGRGEFPFWDPYLGGGGPSFASLIPQYFFPPSFIVVLLGNGSLAKSLYILFLDLCAGALTYLFLRLRGLGWPGAVTGAIAFAFSGAVIQTTPYMAGQPTAFFSLPLLLTARLLDQPGPRRAAQLALGFAFVALASFPPVLLQIFGMCVVYLVVALSLSPERRRARAGWFAAGAAVALAMAAVVYLPALRLMAESPHVQAYYRGAAVAVIRARRLGQLLSPLLMNGAPIYADPPVMPNSGHHFYYVGVVALVLAALGSLSGGSPQERLLRLTALASGGLALAKVLGVPPVQWIAWVPLLRNFHYAAYLGIMIAYCVAVLAALGVQGLLAGRVRLWHVAASGALLALALVLVRVQAEARAVRLHPEGWRWLIEYRLLAVLAALAVGATLLALSRRHPQGRAVALVVALLAAEGVSNGIYPRPRRWDVWAHPPPFIRLMIARNTGGRVLPLPRFPANTESVFGQPTLDAILTASTRMYHFYNRYFGPLPDVILRDTKQIPEERVLDLANIEYLAIAPIWGHFVREAEARGYETLYEDEFVRLMRRPVVPHYTFTSRYLVSSWPLASLAMLPSLPRSTVLLERAASFAADPAAPDDVTPRVVEQRLNAVTIAVDTPRAGLLVCADSHMSGWTATVDGRATAILPANYAFRAIEVPPGAHVVRLSYHAPGFTGGLVLSALGALVCALGWRRRR